MSDLATVRTLLKELANAPSVERAEDFFAGLQSAPADQQAALISDALEHTHLHDVRDRRGVTYRHRLIDALLGLGFPHALHVTPEDLAYHRGRRPVGSLPGVVTVVSATLTLVWLTGWLLLAWAGASTFGDSASMAIFAGLALCFGHAIAAILSVRASRDETRPTSLKVLGGMVVCGPLGIGLSALAIGPPGATLAAAVGLPSIFTALMCLWTASSLSAARPRPTGGFETSSPLPTSARETSPRTSTRLSD